MSRVAIFGLGRIGSRLAEQLVLDNVCEELLLWTRTLDKVKGFVDSLEMLGQIAVRKTVVESLRWGRLDEVDLVVIAIKESYDPRDLLANGSLPKWLPQDLRYVGLGEDIGELHSLARELRGYSGKVLVMTNPVDLMASLLTVWLPSAKIFGSGLTLDEARLSAFMARKFGGVAEDFQVVLGGEHGPSAVPLKSRWQGRALDVLSERDEIIAQLINATHQFGFKVVGELGYTLHDAAYVFSRDIQWLLRESLGFRSFSVWHDGACVGRPVGIGTTGGGLHWAALEAHEEEAIVAELDNVRELVDKTSEEWSELF